MGFTLYITILVLAGIPACGRVCFTAVLATFQVVRVGRQLSVEVNQLNTSLVSLGDHLKTIYF